MHMGQRQTIVFLSILLMTCFKVNPLPQNNGDCEDEDCHNTECEGCFDGEICRSDLEEWSTDACNTLKCIVYKEIGYRYIHNVKLGCRDVDGSCVELGKIMKLHHPFCMCYGRRGFNGRGD